MGETVFLLPCSGCRGLLSDASLSWQSAHHDQALSPASASAHAAVIARGEVTRIPPRDASFNRVFSQHPYFSVASADSLLSHQPSSCLDIFYSFIHHFQLTSARGCLVFSGSRTTCSEYMLCAVEDKELIPTALFSFSTRQGKAWAGPLPFRVLCSSTHTQPAP